MVSRFSAFVRALALTWVGTAGVLLTTSAVILFVSLEALRLLGVVTNAYVGLLSYLLLPVLFVIGLVLIPVGWRLVRRRTGMSARELVEHRFDRDWTKARMTGSALAAWILGLTLANVAFLGIGGARALKFMDEPDFCGTACHSVMGPEWATYQGSPHARVRCVDCHVGTGPEAALDAKLNGLWQMVSVTFDLYERPIPTPVHNLRPARETCETCHWPDKMYGTRTRTITHYDNDRASTPRYTTLALKIGSGTGERRGEIHWHVADQNEVRYASTGRERKTMAWVDVRQPDGTFRRYTNRKVAAGEHEPVRTFDCVDCHNRATHIYEDPERAVERRMESGEIDSSLPFAKKVALEALTGSYPTRDAAMEGIANDVRGFYEQRAQLAHLAMDPRIDATIASLQEIYARNIHPRMNVEWSVYPDHRGHRNGGGCFRCHNPDLVDEAGQSVSSECTLCHSFMAYDSPTPYELLQPSREKDPEAAIHEYLRQELLGAGSAAGEP